MITDSGVADIEVKSNLFKDVKYYVAGTIEPETQKLLENGGATSTKIMFTNITHLLCGKDFDEKDIAEATDIYDIPSVTGEWVIASARLGRLACTKVYHPMPSNLFQTIIAAISELNTSDRKRLYALITYHGGRVERNFTSKTTHLICGAAAGNVYNKAIEMKLDKLSIVTPDWILECVKRQELIDSKPFHPRLLVANGTMQNNIIEQDNRSLSNILGLDDSKADKKIDKTSDHANGILEFIMKTESMQLQSATSKSRSNTPVVSSIADTQQSLVPVSMPVPVSRVISDIKLPQATKPVTVNHQTNDIPEINRFIQPNQTPPIAFEQANTPVVNSMVVHQQQPMPNQESEIQVKTQPISTQSFSQTPISSVQAINQMVQRPQFQQQPQSVQPMINQQQNVNISSQQQIVQQNPMQSNQMQQVLVQQTQIQNTVHNNQIQMTQNHMQPNQMQSNQMPPNQHMQVNQMQSNQMQVNQVQVNQMQSNAMVQQHVQMNTIQNNNGQTMLIKKPNIQQGPPTQRILVSQQQFNQLTPQQQQQFLNNPQNQSVVFINQSGQQQIITSNQSPGNNIALIQQQRNVQTSQSPMGQNVNRPVFPQQMQAQQILIQSSPIQQPQLQQQQQQHTQGMMQNMQQKIIQQSPGGTQQIIQQQLITSPHNQTILITNNNQSQAQAPSQTPPMQQIGQQVLIQNQSQMQNMQQKIIQQSPGGTQQIIQQQVAFQQDSDASVMGQQHNQTILITGNQTPTQQSSRTPPMQQMSQQQQGMMQGQSPMQKIHVQNQQVLQSPQPQQMNTASGPPQFIPAARPQWQGNQQGMPQRQLIRLDAQQHAHLQSLDPIARADYLSKLQKRNILLRQQQQSFAAGAQQRPQGHIIVRGQVPPNQMQWIQQQPQTQQQSPQQRSMLIRTPTPGMNQMAQQPQQQTIVNQGNIVVQQQSPVPQSPIAQSPIPQSPVHQPPRFPVDQITSPIPQIQQQQQQQQQQQVTNVDSATNPVQMNKTKTALANMLSNRLGNTNGPNMPIAGPEVQPIVEPSAAGTLRMISAQHNTNNMPLEVDVQRRTLNNITNNQPTTPVPMQSGIPPQSPQQMIQSPSGMKSPPFSPSRQMLSTPRPQFYGHNPNLKLPPELFLLGCIFYIVEYDETNEKDLPHWKELIRRHGGEIESLYSPRVTHVLCKTQRHGVVMQAIRDSKRCVTAYWLSDTILRKQVVPPSQALHLPMPSTFGTQRPLKKHIICLTGFEGDERERIKKMIDESGAERSPYFSKFNSVLICKKLDGKKFKKAKEWNTPVVNCIWLNDILQGNLTHMSQYDQPKYQQYNLTAPLRIDYTFVNHLMTAWKSPINLTQDSHERVKRMLAEPPVNEPKPKKIRKSEPLEVLPDEIVCNEKPEQVPRILLSQVDNVYGLENAIKSLGGEIVTQTDSPTHIVLTRLARTEKLLFALCTVDHIVTSDWIVESAKAGKFLHIDKFLWDVKPLNEQFNGNIMEAIGSPTRKTLFAGKTFFITPSVRPNCVSLKKLIELCGGKVETGRRSASQIIQSNNQQPDSFIILTCASDLHLLIDLMKSGKLKRVICTTELILTAIMQQKIDLDAHTLSCQL